MLHGPVKVDTSAGRAESFSCQKDQRVYQGRTRPGAHRDTTTRHSATISPAAWRVNEGTPSACAGSPT